MVRHQCEILLKVGSFSACKRHAKAGPREWPGFWSALCSIVLAHLKCAVACCAPFACSWPCGAVSNCPALYNTVLLIVLVLRTCILTDTNKKEKGSFTTTLRKQILRNGNDTTSTPYNLGDDIFYGDVYLQILFG